MSFIDKMLRRYLGGMGGGHHGPRYRRGGYDDYRDDDRKRPADPVDYRAAGPSCPQCRASNPPGARFCAQCGTALPANCPQCGAALPAGAKFCASCGRAVAP